MKTTSKTPDKVEALVSFHRLCLPTKINPSSEVDRVDVFDGPTFNHVAARYIYQFCLI